MHKVIHNNKVIDIVKQPKFVRFLSNGRTALTDKTSAHGVFGSDDKTIYSFKPIIGKNLLVVELCEVSAEESKRLQSLLDSGQTINADDSELEKAKQLKINSLSILCRNKIVAGFSIKLSDGNTYHFKLTTEDQLNLMLIENQIANGENFFIYHATNQPCQIYSREDMIKIIRAFRAHTLYHTTYFNAVKHHIKALTDIEKVNLFVYGTDVSATIENPILKQILKNGGNLA
jgi:hypothetical protein